LKCPSKDARWSVELEKKSSIVSVVALNAELNAHPADAPSTLSSKSGS
jgi:hypothetical protein